jgi:hypothetical protein
MTPIRADIVRSNAPRDAGQVDYRCITGANGWPHVLDHPAALPHVNQSSGLKFKRGHGFPDLIHSGAGPAARLRRNIRARPWRDRAQRPRDEVIE